MWNNGTDWRCKCPPAGNRLALMTCVEVFDAWYLITLITHQCLATREANYLLLNVFMWASIEKKGGGEGLFQQSAFSCTVNNEAQFKRDQWIILWWEISRVLLQMI